MIKQRLIAFYLLLLTMGTCGFNCLFATDVNARALERMTFMSSLKELFEPIIYFLFSHTHKTITVDPGSYRRFYTAKVGEFECKFYSGDLYVHRKGILSSERVFLEKSWEKVWIGNVPINGVVTQIAFCIRFDVQTYLDKHYTEWCSNAVEGLKHLNKVRT